MAASARGNVADKLLMRQHAAVQHQDAHSVRVHEQRGADMACCTLTAYNMRLLTRCCAVGGPRINQQWRDPADIVAGNALAGSHRRCRAAHRELRDVETGTRPRTMSHRDALLQQSTPRKKVIGLLARRGAGGLCALLRRLVAGERCFCSKRRGAKASTA